MTTETTKNEKVTGVILAGGRARRMGGDDKGLIELKSRPMVSHIIAKLSPQVGAIVINANRNQDEYQALGECDVVADEFGDFAGPLAGMASAMGRATTPYIVTVPCDSPLLAPDLVARLFNALVNEDAEIAVAHDGERIQPVFALLATGLRESIMAFLDSGERKIDKWYETHRVAYGDFRDTPDMFLNINTPEQRNDLETRMGHVLT